MILLSNCDYIAAKQDIESGNPISQKTFEKLVKLKKTYCDGIREELSKPIQKCDTGWLAKMTKEKNEIEDLIRMAKVA